MKFGIVVAKDIERAHDLAKSIRKFLAIKGHKVLDETHFRQGYGGQGVLDVVVTLGGDGTLIHAACEHVELGVPFVGINVGTLGFLTAAEGDEWQKAVERLIKGEYVVSERMMLEASLEANSKFQTPNSKLQIPNSKFRALNEVVVKGMYRVVDLEITVDGQKFLSIVGDGVIVATQTGSTAYSLSAGGPIVDPAVDCFLITPVNAVGLPIPSVALSPEDIVEIRLKKGDDVSLIIDGQEHTKVSKSQSIKVSRGRYRVKLGYFDKHHFLKALNAKFGLGGRTLG